MFESLSGKLQNLFSALSRKGKLTEADVNDAAREIRVALLEADVNYKVAKDFIAKIKELAVGSETLSGLNAAQNVIKIVRDQLIEFLGENGGPLKTAPKSPSVYLIAGLQGGGKTTTSGKLASMLRKQGMNPLLAATDVTRPAAVTQLQVVGEAVHVPVFQMGTRVSPVDVARGALIYAREHGHTHLIVDTAGRMHVDGDLMDEIVAVRDAVNPDEILLVLDAMTGQDAVNVAGQFNERLDVTGFILTKMDGDARGGAALSIRQVTGKPIKFFGMGEKYDALEVFHADRLASRILGMGDVLSLIEKVEASVDADEAAKLEKKMRNRTFDLEDFLGQLEQMSKLGPLDQFMDMIPGMAQIKQQAGPITIDPKKIAHMRAIIQSMTPRERREPELVRGSRRRRISRGSGRPLEEINMLLKQFDQMREMFGKMGGAFNQKGGKPNFGNLGFGKMGGGKFKLPF
jgi:signal recognition particle subunit SRP54